MGSHLHSMPLRRHVPSHKSEAAILNTSSLELHRGLVHGQTVSDLVMVECELRTSRWPDRDFDDGGEKLDEPLRNVGEHL